MSKVLKGIRRVTVLGCCVALAGCTLVPAGQDQQLVEGPPIRDVVTPFDLALGCLEGQISKKLTFAVGVLPDTTGKAQFGDGGSGNFVSQGAGDVVQSALFKAGVTLINRRDTSVLVDEARWGIRDLSGQVPANFVLTGSVSTLDFLPGGGGFASIGGVGPRYRQNRILVALDLAITNANTGQIVANIPLQKQIFADELGVGGARFVGDTLISFDAGEQRREALNFALRQMLYLASFELLTQLLPPEKYHKCRALIDEQVGAVTGPKTTGPRVQEYLTEQGLGDMPSAEAVGTVVPVSDTEDAFRNAAAYFTAPQTSLRPPTLLQQTIAPAVELAVGEQNPHLYVSFSAPNASFGASVVPASDRGFHTPDFVSPMVGMTTVALNSDH